MGRERSPDRDKAKEIYLKSKGTIKLKDIAMKLGLADTQIRKWKSIDRWDDELKGTLPIKKSNVTNKKKKEKPSLVERLSEDDIEDDGLTEKQRLFCFHFMKSHNATLAALKAGYSKNSAHVEGCRLLKNDKVKSEINRLRAEIQSELLIDAMDLLQDYVKIAKSDITDYVKFGRREVQVMGAFGPIYEGDGDDKKPVMKTVNYIDLNESDLLDGTLIKEIKQGKDGVSIKLEDKAKARDKLAEYLGVFNKGPKEKENRFEEEFSELIDS